MLSTIVHGRYPLDLPKSVHRLALARNATGSCAKQQLRLDRGAAFKTRARSVGGVIGKLQLHRDQSVYDRRFAAHRISPRRVGGRPGEARQCRPIAGRYALDRGVARPSPGRLRAIDHFVMEITPPAACVHYRAVIIRAPERPATGRQTTMMTRSTFKAFALGAVAVALGTAAAPARAHELQTGTVMICDTEKQVERFVALFDGNAQAAAGAVNAEEQNPTACAVVDIAYVSGPKVGMARSRTDAFQIVPIIAVAVNTPAGLRSISPAFFFTLVKVREYSV
jgi:hypothetical protein